MGEVQGPLASAEALRRDGKYEDARKALDAAVAQAAPDDVELWCGAGALYLAIGPERLALAAAERAVAAAPESWRAQVLVSRARRRLGDFAESVHAARHAVLLAPLEAEAHDALGHALYACGQRGFSLLPLGTGGEARRALRRAAELRGPVSPAAATRRRVKLLLGLTLLVLGSSALWCLWGARIAGNVLVALKAVPAAIVGIGALVTGEWRHNRGRIRGKLRADPGEARLHVLHRVAPLTMLGLIATGTWDDESVHVHPSSGRVTLVAAVATLVILGWLAVLRWWYGREVWRTAFGSFVVGAHVAITLLFAVAPAVFVRTGMLRESDVALKGALVWVTVGFAGTWIVVAVRRRRRLRAAIAQPPALAGRPQGPFA
ncbi:hypothetical protein ACFYYN_11300 [Streptomyces sp. NPDC001902]